MPWSLSAPNWHLSPHILSCTLRLMNNFSLLPTFPFFSGENLQPCKPDQTPFSSNSPLLCGLCPSSLSLCISECVCAYPYVWIYMCHAGACGGQKSIVYLPSTVLHLSFWDRVSHWTWSSLLELDWLVSKLEEFPCLLFSIAEIACIPMVFSFSFFLYPFFFWHSTGNLTTGSHPVHQILNQLSCCLKPWFQNVLTKATHTVVPGLFLLVIMSPSSAFFEVAHWRHHWLQSHLFPGLTMAYLKYPPCRLTEQLPGSSSFLDAESRALCKLGKCWSFEWQT